MILAVLTLLALAAAALLVALLVAARPRPRKRIASEMRFVDPLTRKHDRAPSLYDVARGQVELSVVIPAYNETARLAGMLDEALEHLQRPGAPSFEIVVVDDGSRDGTAAFARRYARAQGLDGEKFRVLVLARNRGKGGAVAHGMLHCRGRRILFADADGASRFADVEKLHAALDKLVRRAPGAKTGAKTGDEPAAITVGSRSHLVSTDAVVRRSALRNFLMRSFHTVLYLLGVGDIGDTQCGFKLFTRAAAQLIFVQMHVQGWIFDIEILLIARMFGMPVAEVPVTWHEIAGSKISVLRDSALMLKDLLVLRLCYGLGVWRLRRTIPELHQLYAATTAPPAKAKRS